MSLKVLPAQTFCDSLLPYSSRGNWGKEEDEDDATHSKAQKENIPALAVQDPSRTDHILFVIAPSPARICYLKTAAEKKKKKKQLLITNKNPGIKQEREAAKVVEEAQ